MSKYCCFNGKIAPEKEAGVSLRDLGVLRGYGVFEVMIFRAGEIFIFSEHFKRLTKSSFELGLKIPTTQKNLENLIKKLVAKNNLKEAIVRIFLTGGISSDGMNVGKIPTLFILVDEYKKFPPACYKRGIKLIIAKYQREIPGLKTSNYVQAIKLQKLRKKKKAFEILYIQNGLVLEATTSNFFIFKGNTLITPKNNVLLGTTRNFVIKIAKSKFKTIERDIKRTELSQASEAFITATIKKVMPVVKIENLKIGDGKVGKNTKWLMEEFEGKMVASST